MRAGVLSPWGLTIFPLYLMVILLISWGSRRRWRTSNDYLNASRSLPTWAAALSLLAYNCGSIEVIGMSAMAAQYGVQALHFYWIGGIPGMIFLGIVVLPIYMRTGARSLPEYLGMRFGAKVRLLNACISMVGTAGFAGVAIYALAQVLHVIMGWELAAGALASASVVLVYVLLGGLRATIFTSVFQLFVMVAGLTPLLFMTVHFNAATFAQRSDRWHLWKALPVLAPHAPLDCVGVAFGLGSVISFSYWCTDFVLIQRALTARTIEAARKVPLLAGFGKLAFAMLVVLPGGAAPALLSGTHAASFDESIPALMTLAFGPTLLALGTAALLASLMAGLAGNVSGFSAVWTEEIYRIRLRPDRSEQHYIRTGRIAVVCCFVLALVAAYVTLYFHDLMEFLQLIVALFYAPVFAAVLAGLFSRRTTERGAFAGILLGVFAAFALQTSCWMGFVHFGSQMTTNFYEAMLSFSVAMLGCVLYKKKGNGKEEVAQLGLVLDASVLQEIRLTPALAVLTATLLACCLVLNVLWW
ncbi:MAG: sodium/solute symporter [Terracidiphilus sp.]